MVASRCVDVFNQSKPGWHKIFYSTSQIRKGSEAGRLFLLGPFPCLTIATLGILYPVLVGTSPQPPIALRSSKTHCIATKNVHLIFVRKRCDNGTLICNQDVFLSSD